MGIINYLSKILNIILKLVLIIKNKIILKSSISTGIEDYKTVLCNSIQPTALRSTVVNINEDTNEDITFERTKTADDIKELFRNREFTPEIRDYLEYHAERIAFLMNIISFYIQKLNKKHNESLQILNIGRIDFPTECIRKLFDEGNLILRTVGFGEDQPEIVDEHLTFDLNDALYREKWIATQAHDIILFAETIEHLYTSPKLVLSFIKSLLDPNGFLIIQTPNAVSIEKRIAMVNGSNPYELIRERRDDPGHFREYTASELMHIGKEVDLVCDKIVYSDYWPQNKSYIELINKYPELRAGITMVFKM